MLFNRSFACRATSLCCAWPLLFLQLLSPVELLQEFDADSSATEVTKGEPLVFPGVVIEEISDDSALKGAGLQPGDIVLTWERLPHPPANPQGESGVIENIFDWVWLEIEQAPRGSIRLGLMRGTDFLYLPPVTGKWTAATRPSFTRSALQQYRAIQKSTSTAPSDVRERLVHQLCDLVEPFEAETAAAILFSLGNTYSERRRLEAAAVALGLAREQSKSTSAMLAITAALGRNLDARSALVSAATEFTLALSDHRICSDQALYCARAKVSFGRNLRKQGKVSESAIMLQEAVETIESEAPGSLLLAVAHLETGNTLRDLRNLGAAKISYESALNIYRRLIPGGSEEVSALQALGTHAYFEGDLNQAEAMFHSALSLVAPQSRSKHPHDISVANLFSNMAMVAFSRGQWRRSLDFDLQALEIHERIQPQSLGTAAALNAVGLAYKNLGNRSNARIFLTRARDMRATLAPQSRVLAESILNLATIEADSDNFETAVNLISEAEEMIKQLEGAGILLASALVNKGNAYRQLGELAPASEALSTAIALFESDQATAKEYATAVLSAGSIAFERGDFDLAEERYFQSFDSMRGYSPTPVELGALYLNLGAVAQRTRRPVEAEVHYREAIDLLEVGSQQRSELSEALSGLTIVLLEQGQIEEARRTGERALRIQGRNRHNRSAIAGTLHNLAEIARSQGEIPRAVRLYERASSILRRPETIQTAACLYDFAAMLLEVGDFRKATRTLLEAHKIAQQLAPGTWIEASIQHGLGLAVAAAGDSKSAMRYFGKAVESLESQIAHLGSSIEERGRFLVAEQEIYTDSISSMVHEGLYSEAFVSLERSRARALKEVLRSRRIEFQSENASKAGEQLASLEVKIARLVDERSEVAGGLGGEKGSSAHEEFVRLRESYRVALAEIQADNPRLSLLWRSEALTQEEVSSALDSGTVMLSYMVDSKSLYLFVVSRDSRLVVVPRKVGSKVLRQKIERFRGILSSAHIDSRLGELRLAELRQLGKELFDILLKPAEAEIEKAERVMIVADGPLHHLPFATLTREVVSEDGVKRDQYLAEWKPFHFVLSATVFAELKKDRRDPSKPDDGTALQFVAFGDPVFPNSVTTKEADKIADIRVRSAARRGALELAPLPYTRREVEGITALFPRDRVQTFLGAEATEEKAKAIGKGARILHFATHARLDDRFPLNSSLLLSMPEGFPEDQENGLLQASNACASTRIS